MSDLAGPRKKSPRAPSIALDEALERVLRAYDKERLHPAPTEVVAQNLGYKGASSGSALSAMASLRYYGLLERPSDGVLAVTKEVESWKFAPDEAKRRAFVLDFLRRPVLFAELLEKYASGLPSDANLKYELIQRGFLPGTAADVVAVFRRSVEFADYFNTTAPDLAPADQPSAQEVEPAVAHTTTPMAAVGVQTKQQGVASIASFEPPTEDSHDRIPVRLPGGRRAWLVIPTPFFKDDKVRLKAHIDLLLAEDDQNTEG